jgi:ferredoxin
MITVNIEKCGHYGACAAVCPTNSIELVEFFLTVGDACTTGTTCSFSLSCRALTAREEGA